MIMAQENALLKAKEEFQKIEETIRQATIQGKRIDVVEENPWDQIQRIATSSLFSASQNYGWVDNYRTAVWRVPLL